MIHWPWWTEPKGREPEISHCLEASISVSHINSLECSSKDVNAVSFIRLPFAFLHFKLNFMEVAAFTICKGLINMKLSEIPFSHCRSLAFCFDHTILWQIHRQRFNSCWSGPSLIGTTRNKSKQETGLLPKRAHNALETSVSCDFPVSYMSPHVTFFQYCFSWCMAVRE